VIGCRYVGLVMGDCPAELSHNVAGNDNDDPRIEALRSGKLQIYEAFFPLRIPVTRFAPASKLPVVQILGSERTFFQTHVTK
jgi:UDP-glucose/GDP-mannose dehydrogenase family, NAD binding domain